MLLCVVASLLHDNLSATRDLDYLVLGTWFKINWPSSRIKTFLSENFDSSSGYLTFDGKSKKTRD